MEYYIRAFQNYANFKGRDTRKQYWMFFLFNCIVSFVVGFVSGLFLGDLAMIVVDIYTIAVVIPGISISIRRMHDIGKSGWWILVSVIPFVGWIWYFILVCTPGDICENEYGMPSEY